MPVEHVLNDGWEFIQTNLDHPHGSIGYSRAEWMSANVPGHIHLDLIDHGIIADPFERMYEIGAQWVDDQDWSYRCRFQWSPSEELPNRVLQFEGLDTICTVKLNGVQIGAYDNMFVSHEIDITEHLADGQNELRIDFQSPVRVGNERRSKFLAQKGLPDDTELLLERSFVRKVQCMYGWDWGPRLASCGIWRPIRLIEFASRITDFSVQQEWNPDGCTVTVIASANLVGQGTLHYTLVSPDQEVVRESDSGRFEIEAPELWWPVTMGDQPMYTVLVHDELASVSASKQIGLRQIKLLREIDELGQSFEFEVNWHKVYCKGFNWIPDHSFPAVVGREQYEERIHQAVDLGANMLRVWGGGLYELDDFYDICDEQGVLVWQDFPFACAYYPDEQEHLEIIRVEASANIKRLRHRACLALWCGNNENLTMWEGKWDFAGGTQPDRFYGERIYNELLPAMVAELDPERSYIPTSPIGKEGGTDANCDHFGDAHYWDVWHGRGDWKHYADSKTRFSSEYGFASSPSLPVWNETLSESDWDYESNAVRWHNKTRKPFETFRDLVQLHYPESQSLEDWAYYSQLNQRDALRAGVEHFRRNPSCRGSLIWQLNDCWPVESWAVIDSSGRYKAAAYELLRLYAESMLSIERSKQFARIHYVDDRHTGETLRNVYFAKAVQLTTGDVLREWEFEFEVSPGDRLIANEIDLTGLPVSETILHIWTPYTEGTWHLMGQPKDAQFAAPSRILASVDTRDEHGPFLVIQVEQPMVDLMLTVDGDPAVFAENFQTFVEPGLYRIPIVGSVPHFEARSLAGHHATHMTRSPLA